MTTACLGHVGATTTTTTDDLADVPHNVTCVETALDQILGDASDEHGLVIDDCTQYDGAAAQFIPERVCHLAHGIEL